MQSPAYFAPPATDSSLRHGDKAALAAALQDARVQLLAALAPLTPPVAVPYERCLNPLLWEIGHVAWFADWFVARNPSRALGVMGTDWREPLPSDLLYDSGRVAHASRWHLPLPSLQHTLEHLQAQLGRSLAHLSRDEQSDAGLYCHRLALAHEDMHTEALRMAAHHLGLAALPPLQPHKNNWLAVGAGQVALGTPPDSAGFWFDNELGHAVVEHAGFQIRSAPISRAEFAAGLRLQGQHERAQAVLNEPGQHPDAPMAAVSWQDANAYAQLMGESLPSEAQWVAAATSQCAAFAWGQVWEWTNSWFTPFEGFAPHPYRDYSAPWFHTHRVLKGASAWTSTRMRHPLYRNFFAPDRTDVLSGFRTVKAIA